MLNDLLGGHIPMSFLSVALIDQAIRAGKLQVFAGGGSRRLPLQRAAFRSSRR
jgi:tripartite-type tricarboxylate transporter receptor subunit TctC